MFLNVLICALITFAYGGDSPVVETTIGPVQGTVASDGEYFSFYGIPYGGSVAGKNRFKAPTPPPTFEETFIATDDSVLCAQPGPDGPIGVEDCLRLNIFTKDFTNNIKPVFVWLIGEEYTTSNPLQHSFRKLVEENLVVVALNYRLSVFGFLCLGIEEAPGNAGLRDVLQGLKWIQDNIGEFGGNPHNVVLFGHGSGAAMVDLVTLSPLAQNLAHKAIYHSGSALSPWAVSYDPIGSAVILHNRIERNRGASVTNYRTELLNEELRELVAIFKSATVNELINAANEFKFLNNTVLFAPCIENIDLDPENTVLHDAPINILENNTFLDIPYIAGYTDGEGTIRANEAINGQWMKEMQHNFTNFLPVDMKFEEPFREMLIRMIREHHFGNKIMNMDLIREYLDYHGDTMIIIPVIRSIMLKDNWWRVQDARLLEFSYRRTNNTDWPLEGVAVNGVQHGGFLNFLLDFDLATSDTEVMESLVERYVNFAYTGQPTVEDFNLPHWFSFGLSASYLLFGGSGEDEPGETPFRFQRLSFNPRERQSNFWINLYEHFSKAPLPPTPVTQSAAKSTMALSLIVFSIILALV